MQTYLSKYSNFIPSDPAPISLSEYSDYTPFATTLAYTSPVTSANAEALKSQFKSDYWKMSVPSTSSTADEWDNSVFSQWGPSLFGSYQLTQYDDSTNKKFAYTTMVNSQHQMAMPILINSMNQAIIKSVNSAVEINVINRPLRFTEKFKGLEGATDGIIGGFIFSIALAFIPASIITFSVKEREDQVKHQQMVCGVSIFSYWTSNFLMDYLKHLVPAGFSILMALAFGIDTFTKEADSFGALALLFVLYGWSMINFAYVTGFFFKSYGNAQVATFFIHFILVKNYQSLKKQNEVIQPTN